MPYFCKPIFRLALNYPYKNLIILSFLMLAFSCKKEPEPPAPLPIPTPKFEVPKTLIDLGNITSKSTGQFTLKKNGIGKISYTISSNKNWLKLDNFDGKLGLFLSDIVKFSSVLPSIDLIDGDNVAVLTVTPTINDVASTPISIEVKGNFKTTSVHANTQSIDLGTIKGPVKAKFVLTKTGLENATFEANSDKSWINLDHANGSIVSADTITLNIDPRQLSGGVFNGKITIVPKILGINGSPITISINGIYDDTISGEIQGHTLLKDENWEGEISLTGTVVVPKGVKLNLKPGTVVSIKKASTPISITVFGKLVMNGNISNIIELKSSINAPSNSDWAGIISNGEIELSYALIKHAKNAVSFEFFNLSSNSIVPKIHHVLFDNCFVGIMEYQVKAETTLNNLSFRNNELFSIVFTDFKKTTVESSEFLNETGYIDLNISASNGNLNIINCNFVQKKFGFQSQLEVIDGNKFNAVTATNCYALYTKNGFWVNGNSFSSSNDLSAPNPNIGCGFINKYPSARKKSK